MGEPLKAIPIGVPNLRDVTRMLRRLADQIDAGEKPAIDMAVLVGRQVDGSTVTYGWGDVPNVVTAVGLLQWGIAHLIHEPEA